jgi:hypothetical protein
MKTGEKRWKTVGTFRWVIESDAEGEKFWNQETWEGQ